MSLRACIFLSSVLAASLFAAEKIEPPQIIQTVEARFPDALAQRGIYEGEARIVLWIDAHGVLADWLLASCTHPLIGREATEVLPQWRFKPARSDGEPTDARVTLTFGFRASGMIVSINGPELWDRLTPPADNLIERVCRPQDLDAPVAVLKAVRPLWPADWKSDAREGRVLLDFFIDENGRARMPVVAEADDPALGPAAIEALSHWEFAAPTRRGEPVIVKARQSFKFTRRNEGRVEQAGPGTKT